MTTQPKEPLLRMAKRDSISPRAAWGIRAAAFLLALITGGLLLLLLGHNPITVYSAMTVSYTHLDVYKRQVSTLYS